MISIQLSDRLQYFKSFFERELHRRLRAYMFEFVIAIATLARTTKLIVVGAARLILNSGPGIVKLPFAMGAEVNIYCAGVPEIVEPVQISISQLPIVPEVAHKALAQTSQSPAGKFTNELTTAAVKAVNGVLVRFCAVTYSPTLPAAAAVPSAKPFIFP